MIDILANSLGRDIRVTSVRATLLRHQGEEDAGEQILRDFIEATPPSELRGGLLSTRPLQLLLLRLFLSNSSFACYGVGE